MKLIKKIIMPLFFSLLLLLLPVEDKVNADVFTDLYATLGSITVVQPELAPLTLLAAAALTCGVVYANHDQLLAFGKYLQAAAVNEGINIALVTGTNTIKMTSSFKAFLTKYCTSSIATSYPSQSFLGNTYSSTVPNIDANMKLKIADSSLNHLIYTSKWFNVVGGVVNTYTEYYYTSWSKTSVLPSNYPTLAIPNLTQTYQNYVLLFGAANGSIPSSFYYSKSQVYSSPTSVVSNIISYPCTLSSSLDTWNGGSYPKMPISGYSYSDTNNTIYVTPTVIDSTVKVFYNGTCIYTPTTSTATDTTGIGANLLTDNELARKNMALYPDDDVLTVNPSLPIVNTGLGKVAAYPIGKTISDSAGVIKADANPVTTDTPGDTSQSLPKSNKLNFQPLYLPLADIFPFCIPFDFVNSFRNLATTPVAPRWVIQFPSIMFNARFELNLDPFDKVATILRYFEILAFSVGLIKLTRNQMVKG